MKSFLFLFIFAFAHLPLIVSAQAKYDPLVTIPGVTDKANPSFSDYINFLYAGAIAVAALLAVVKLIVAGVKYMVTDIVPNKGQAISDIKGALLGLLLILGSIVILNTINPTLTQNKITFQKIPDRPDSVRKAPVTAAETTQALLCSQYSGSNLKTIPYQPNVPACGRVLGAGWTDLDQQCCSIPNSDSSKICCGYSETNKGSGGNAAELEPNVGTGNFILWTVQKDSINECYEELYNKYPTLEACNAAQASALTKSTMAVTKDCSGKTVNSPTDKYNAITKLSYCGTSPLAGSLSYGELVQEKYTYTEKITTIDGPTQAAQFKTGCEDKYGQYSIKNGPTGTIVNATVTCKVPNLVKYSGSGSKGMVEDKKDCAALKGEFRLGIFSASYCIMR